MKLFARKAVVTQDLPDVLKPEPPVRYKTVLDYLVELSAADYNKMVKISGIYRGANAEAAKILGVKDKPVTTLKGHEATGDELDTALDTALNADELDLLPMPGEPAETKPAKQQEPSKETKIDIKD